MTDAEALSEAEQGKKVFVAEQVGIAKHKEIEQEIVSLKACGITVAAAVSLE